MGWIVFVAGAVLSWGAYGVLLYLGGQQLGNPLKALLCVGVAYFLIGVIVPVAVLGPGTSAVGLQQPRRGDGQRGRRARRDRGRVHHLRLPRRRPAALRDAARLRRRADRQRLL